ncbi:hypothetical protein [Dictyobacter aurantiacus]|uniref:Uncharacterized protein n=1 Tax=Dictyobacter aurantiacus TaxID=1936993 RepID=A0A401ZSE4_9CHLR|nr:hypothetical protein [Dictyobacter aurantiacus]GCE09726.1 hypothetical protein KDAU_70550 [Dictyobacter aurantiacus]
MRKTLKPLKPSHRSLALGIGLAILCIAGALTIYSIEFTSSASAAVGQSSCGTVYVRIGDTTPTNVNANMIEDCFWRAYVTCQPGQSLTYQQTGIDAGTIRDFTLVKRGRYCQITDQMRPYTIVGPGTHHVDFYICSGMYRDYYGLHIQDCEEDGDILVPARHPHIVPLPIHSAPVKPSL